MRMGVMKLVFLGYKVKVEIPSNRKGAERILCSITSTLRRGGKLNAYYKKVIG